MSKRRLASRCEQLALISRKRFKECFQVHVCRIHHLVNCTQHQSGNSPNGVDNPFTIWCNTPIAAKHTLPRSLTRPQIQRMAPGVRLAGPLGVEIHRNRTETATAMREHGARWQDLNADDQIRFSSRQDLGRVGTGSTQKRNAQADAPGSIGNSNAPLSRVASRRSAPARFCVDKGWGIPADQYQPDQALGMGDSWQPEHG